MSAAPPFDGFEQREEQALGRSLVLAVAVRGAHEALTLELALELGAEQLHDECRRLESALEELRATQERLLHAERLTTVGRIVGTLIGQATDHLCTLEGFKAIQQHRLLVL